jgi:hypothetical protein
LPTERRYALSHAFQSHAVGLVAGCCEADAIIADLDAQ